MYSPTNLPNGMVGLHTPEGQKLLEESSVVNKLLVERCKDQVNRTFCGIASTAAALNGMNVATRVKYMLHQQQHQKKHPEQQQHQHQQQQQEDFFDQDEEILQQHRVTEDDIVAVSRVEAYLTDVAPNLHVDGLTMRQLNDMIAVLGFGTEVYHAVADSVDQHVRDKVNETVANDRYVFSTCEQFKRVATELIVRPVSAVIANYDMKVLGYEG